MTNEYGYFWRATSCNDGNYTFVKSVEIAKKLFNISLANEKTYGKAKLINEVFVPVEVVGTTL